MSFNDTVKDNRDQGDKFGERRVLKVFTPGKEGHSPQPMRQTEKTKDERVLESIKIVEPGSQRRTWLVKTLENMVLAPRYKQVAAARLETEKAQNLPALVYVEPAQIPIERFFQPEHSRVKPSTRQSSQLKQPSDETVTRSANTEYVMLANFSEETLTVPKHTVLGIAQQV